MRGAAAGAGPRPRTARWPPLPCGARRRRLARQWRRGAGPGLALTPAGLAGAAWGRPRCGQLSPRRAPRPLATPCTVQGAAASHARQPRAGARPAWAAGAGGARQSAQQLGCAGGGPTDRCPGAPSSNLRGLIAAIERACRWHLAQEGPGRTRSTDDATSAASTIRRGIALSRSYMPYSLANHHPDSSSQRPRALPRQTHPAHRPGRPATQIPPIALLSVLGSASERHVAAQVRGCAGRGPLLKIQSRRCGRPAPLQAALWAAKRLTKPPQAGVAGTERPPPRVLRCRGFFLPPPPHAAGARAPAHWCRQWLIYLYPPPPSPVRPAHAAPARAAHRFTPDALTLTRAAPRPCSRPSSPTPCCATAMWPR